MRIELLVGADEFWSRLQADLRDARRSAYVQTFTFEGDRAGTSLARALDRCTATDRRLLVDSYSLLYHSDRWIFGPAWLDRRFRREVCLTHRWVERLRRGGAQVRFGNPVGPGPTRLVRRSHKKLAAIDDRIVYLGGINFSDHNFAWHDMMLRIECAETAVLLSDDFRACWEGRPRAWDRSVGELRLVSLNGRGNREGFRPVLEAIEGAQSSIDVVSAYLSHPFTDYLGRAAARGVRVRVLTPERNNKANLARHILRRARRRGFEVLRYAGGMSHMKAMVIDDELLVAGSSNFDFMSHTILEEHVVLTRHTALVDDFRRRVWNPEIARARRAAPRRSLGTLLGDLAVRAGAFVASRLAKPQGDIDMDTRSIRNRLAATILAFAVATACLAPLQASAQVGAGRSLSVEVPEVARLEGRRMARPAWVVGDVPDTVWVLVERAAAAGGDETAMRSALEEAELRAREALVGNEKNAGRRFALAVVLGVRADREGGRSKVGAASALYEELDTLLTLDPEHASARHMMGRLHAGVRRMNGVTRWLATNLLGGATLKQASWEAAEEHLAFAERSAPSVPDHHLQLARLYLDTGRPERAVAELDHVLAMEPHSPLEAEVRREADGLRAGLEAR